MRLSISFMVACFALCAMGYLERSIVGARKTMLSDDESLPYDVAIEYLESTGQQWIKTPIAYESGIIRIEGRVIATDNLTVTNPRRIYLGTGDFNSSDGIFLGFYSQQQYFDKIGAFGNLQGSSASTTYDEGFILEYDSETSLLYRKRRNGNTSKFFEETKDIFAWNKGKTFNNIPITLFAANEMGDNTSGYRMYWIRIFIDGELVLDCIPVKKDGIGYMFDRVLGMLLETLGIQSFICGPDL